MKSLFCLTINPDVSLEEAWSCLEEAGIEMLYGSEEEEHAQLFVMLNAPAEVDNLTCISLCSPYNLPTIDWEAQWSAHGKDFHDGFVHVDLTSFKPGTPTLKLKPGPGFGDLSHPTTRLALRLLSQKIKNQSLIDIGCGSGVLSLAAAALGANKVLGIDIDPEALAHSRQNALLNHLEKACHFTLTEELTWLSTEKSILIVMNMIQCEQQIAWESLPKLHRQPAEIITSGVPIGDREHYLQLTSTWGWLLKEEIEEDGWMAFYFQMSPSQISNCLRIKNPSPSPSACPSPGGSKDFRARARTQARARILPLERLRYIMYTLNSNLLCDKMNERVYRIQKGFFDFLTTEFSVRMLGMYARRQ